MEAAAETTPVREAHRIDEGALAGWMERNVEGFRGPLTLRQFAGGHSNPTYWIGTPGHAYVLRKKPPGKLLPSAHQVEREYRVFAALKDSAVPVPAVRGLCNDDGVIGTAFFVMDYVTGRVFRDLGLPGVAPAERAAIYDQMNAVLPRCTGWIGRRRAWRISAGPATTTFARSTAGPSSTSPRGRKRSPRWTG